MCEAQICLTAPSPLLLVPATKSPKQTIQPLRRGTPFLLCASVFEPPFRREACLSLLLAASVCYDTPPKARQTSKRQLTTTILPDSQGPAVIVTVLKVVGTSILSGGT